MIYNRTYIDIINARKIFSSKIQKFLQLTDDEQNTVDKAFFNLKAINRITEKINQIWVEIVNYGGTKIQNADVREWTDQEFFDIVNFSNIRQNIADILSQLSFLEFVDIPTYQSAYNKLTDDYIYTNINNLEKLLYDIYELLKSLAVKVDKKLYLIGAYNATVELGVLTIE
jgi:hypothetical protein